MWVHTVCERKGLESNTANEADMLKEVIRLIRFAVMLTGNFMDFVHDRRQENDVMTSE